MTAQARHDPMRGAPLFALAFILLSTLGGITGCGTLVSGPGPDSSTKPSATAATAAASSAITIFVAKEIVTLDARQPSVTAVAVQGKRILATGDLASVQEAVAGSDFEIDRRFADHVLVPGLINQHEHPWLAAILMLTEVLSIEDWELAGREIPRAKNEAEYTSRLAALVEAHSARPEGENGVFYTWGYHQLFHGELDRRDLDEISRDVPIVIFQRSLHETILNTAALSYFGIDAQSIAALPKAARDQLSLEKGHFWEQGNVAAAQKLLGDLLIPSRYIPALQEIEAYWHAAGSTLVAEPGGLVAPGLLAMQNKVFGDADNPFRMVYIADGKTMVSRYEGPAIIEETARLAEAAEGTSGFLPKQVKLFADGAMFSQLMQMSEGYLDGHEGEWLMDPEEFKKAFRIYWDAEYQIHVHQNGDAGLDLVLEALEENMRRNPRMDHRTVIVHFGFSRPDQVDRIARLGAIVSANPFYTVALGDRYSEVGIGPERAHQMARLGDVARARIPFSLHADMPMAPGKPLFLMASAVNRRTIGGNIVGPEQRISPEQALRAVTLEAAYSLQLEDERGSIEPGKLANFTVLAANPLKVAPETIAEIPVWGTVYEGRVLPAR